MIPSLALAAALQFSGATLRVTNVRTDSSGCRSAIEFQRAGATKPRTIWSAKLDAVGLPAGLFIPAQQPSRDYGTVVKSGDYESLLLFVRRDGSLVTHPGGWFWIDRAHELLFTITASDEPEVAVIDLRTLRRAGDDVALIPEAFYRAGRRVFVTGQERAFEFNFARRAFVSVKPDPAHWTRVAWDFDLNAQSHCTSR